MSEDRVETCMGMCVVALTKYIMKKKNIDYEIAYKHLLSTELYKLLKDTETRLFLETNEYLCEAYDAEVENGEEALYEYINTNI